MHYCDAHNHLQDRRLDPHREAILSVSGELGISRAVVNGTREEDWNAVARLASGQSWITPSFGLHPWYVADRSARWLHTLIALLDGTPGSAIGEIGLDRWIEGHDLELQTKIFTAQLQIAADRDLPVTIHCLKAWGALWEMIRSHPLPQRGFLLHAYGGPAEMAQGFVERGAYFSFSTYFLHTRKSAQRELFKDLPLERLLVETDAPDMAPPPEQSRQVISDPKTGRPLNHPANLLPAYEELARLRGMELEELSKQVELNFQRLFGLATA